MSRKDYCTILDDDRMDRLCERYKNSPCGTCKNSHTLEDLSDFRCDCFEDGIIPDEIISGKNKHTTPIDGQLNDKLFSPFHIEYDESEAVMNKCIIAVFQAQPLILEKLLKEGAFDYSLLEDIGGFSKPFPIWRITQCWEVLADLNAFVENAKSDVEDFKKRNDRIIEIFKKELGVVFAPIDYQSYHDDFYCTIDRQALHVLLGRAAYETMKLWIKKYYQKNL